MAQVKRRKVDQVRELFRNAPCKVKCDEKRVVEMSGRMDAPRRTFERIAGCIKPGQIDECAKFLGQGTCEKIKRPVDGVCGVVERMLQVLTVKPAVSHFELFQVRESAPLRRNAARKLVSLPDILATADIENLE